MEELIKVIDGDLKRLETQIEDLIQTDVALIEEIVYHIIRSGGKRIRPVLVCLASRLCGYKDDDCIPYAAVIEFIHTATLLHDDVVDNAAIRRGAKAANAVWGNEASVLAGDFLYAKAFEVMAEYANEEITKTIARTAKRLSEGEMLELVKTSDITTTEEDYFEIIGNKTAALFSAACEIGAILGDVDKQMRSSLKTFGFNLGIAFQLQDDMLDYISCDEVLGKKRGTDLKEGKVTLPLIHAAKNADERELSFIKEVLDKAEVIAEDFKKVYSIIKKYKGIEYTYMWTQKYSESAKGCLNLFEPSPYKDALVGLADLMLNRKA